MSQVERGAGEGTLSQSPVGALGGGKKSREGARCQGSSRCLSQVLLTERTVLSRGGRLPGDCPRACTASFPRLLSQSTTNWVAQNGGRYTLRVLESEIKVSTGLYLSKAQGPPSPSQLWSLPGDLGIP